MFNQPDYAPENQKQRPVMSEYPSKRKPVDHAHRHQEENNSDQNQDDRTRHRSRRTGRRRWNHSWARHSWVRHSWISHGSPHWTEPEELAVLEEPAALVAPHREAFQLQDQMSLRSSTLPSI